MKKVKLTVVESACRSGYHKAGDTFVVEEICPPLCHELWNGLYPYLFALQNGADLDCGDDTLPQFDVRCPDGGRVVIHGELAEE